MASWEPERLASVGHTFKTLSPLLRTGDRVRLGQEGDPLFPYGDGMMPPSAVVTEIRRDYRGLSFDATRDDDSGEVFHLNDTDVAPHRVWEWHPDDMHKLTERVAEVAYRGKGDGDGDAGEEDIAAVKHDLARVVRHLASDIVGIYRGQTPDFALRFVEVDELSDSGFRGSRHAGQTANKSPPVARGAGDDRHNDLLHEAACSDHA